MPTGKINTFANQTLPELVYVAVRDTRPVSLVNAFEVPVLAEQGASRRKVAADRLAQEARDVESVNGFKPLAAYVMGIGETADSFTQIAEKTTLQELTKNIGEVLDRAVGDQ